MSAGITEGPHPSYAWTVGGQHVALRIETALFSEEAVLRASYKFTDRCYVFLQTDAAGDEGVVWAILAGKPGAADVRLLVGEFANELLDQRVRIGLGREFGPLQALIVAQAFADESLADPERDDLDYRADPRGAGRRQ